MNVLLTGATGFLGSHLVKALMSAGHRVVLLKRSHSRCERIAEILSLVTAYDIDHSDMERPFRENSIDAVIHTATCYGRNGEGLEMIARANLNLPLELLGCSIRFGVGLFLNTDTFTATSTVQHYYLPEYHLSKNHFREWGKQASSRHGLFFLNLRLGHLYGPDDSADKFVQSVIRSLIRQVPELKLTLGEQTRDFLYVDDAVSAYLHLLHCAGEHAQRFTEYQVGSGESTSIRSFVELAHRLTGSSTRLLFGALPYRDGELMASTLETKPLRDLGWSPRTGLQEGIGAIIQQLRLNA